MAFVAVLIGAACADDAKPDATGPGDTPDGEVADSAAPEGEVSDVQTLEVETGELPPEDVAVAPRPLGLALPDDGLTYVGVATVDITPAIRETFTDLDGDGEFDGCLDDPTGTREGCAEPFDDIDGDGKFDAIWIAGFGFKRAANAVHDPISVRAMVVTRGSEYLVIAGMDVVGLLQNRIDQARDVLVGADHMDPVRFIAASSHNHQAPDVLGFWGFVDLERGDVGPGFDPEYQTRVVDALVEATRRAASSVRPAEIVMGMADMAERSPWYNGATFGGRNPKSHLRGLIDDRRDPVIAATKVFVMHARDPGSKAGIATLLNFSSHPETWGGENNEISADWVGVARDVIDEALGGTTVFVPESLGGMQSMLGASVPLVDAAGDWVWDRNGDGADDDTPRWAEPGTFDYVHGCGRHVGAAALAALQGAEVVTLEPFEVRRETMRIHVNSVTWSFAASLGIADYDVFTAIRDGAQCPGYSGVTVGCVDTYTWRLRLGPVAIMTAPGELLPEIFHGFPVDDPAWQAESADVSRRGPGATYFPQHSRKCDNADWSLCRLELADGGCDCRDMHAVPYGLSLDPGVPALATLLSDEARYKIMFNAAGAYWSYIIPELDYNPQISILSDRDGDHYEDSVSASPSLATKLQDAQLRLGDDNR